MTEHKTMQLEIFEDILKAKKAQGPQGEAEDRIPNFKFPTQICVKAACLLIVVLVSFALGVERGKLISKNKVSTRMLAESKSLEEVVKEIVIKDEEQIPEPAIEKEEPLVQENKVEEKAAEDAIATSGYLIQVASYKKNSSYIDKEIERLKQKGYSTKTISGKEYMGICAGNFSDKQEAQKHLKILKETYKDCFIKEI
jgi:cell division protein FtsN